MILAIFIYPKLQESGDIYFINFKKMSVSGLNTGATVKYQGVNIGRVSNIKVNPEDLSSILVYVLIEKGFPVKKDMSATLAYTGITGLKFIELSGGETKSENLEPKGEIPTKRGLGEKAEDIVSNIDSAVKGINKFLSEENQKKISLFLDNIEKTSETISTVINNKRKNMEDSISNIERATTQIGEIANHLKEAVEKMELKKIAVNSKEAIQNFTDRFSDKEFGNVLKGIDDFINSANSTLRKLDLMLVNQQDAMNKSLQKLSEVIENLSTFSRNLVEDPTFLIRKRKTRRSKK
jgi:phospholipid/cholesterol/gamma-HCH transport system substrate-binding protein